MPKRNLEDLVGQAVADNGGVLTESRSSEATQLQSPEVPKTGTSGPRYLGLARKDVRLREDQVRALSDAARHLSRQRTNKAERITENTLIRVAVDLLLSHLDDMTGDTEEALLWSLQQ